MQLPWYVTAIGAAIVWGIHYPLVDLVLRHVSIMTVLFVTAVPIVLLAPFFFRTIARDFGAWGQLAWDVRGALLALALTSLSGSVLLFISISGKNATLASLLEITYPVFVALFAFLLLREVQFSPSAVIGGVFVLVGAGLIIWNNP